MTDVRLGIIGSAGTGKSGLGLSVAKKLDIQFLAAKDITRPILEKKGYDWSSEIFVEKFLALEVCQKEILAKTVETQSEYSSFVTDRTSIDLAAYAILELQKEVEIVDEIINACRSHANTYTHLIFCPWGIVPIEDNKVRTINPWYQFAVHSVMMGILMEWDVPFKIVSGTGTSRIDDVLSYVS